MEDGGGSGDGSAPSSSEDVAMVEQLWILAFFLCGMVSARGCFEKW